MLATLEALGAGRPRSWDKALRAGWRVRRNKGSALSAMISVQAAERECQAEDRAAIDLREPAPRAGADRAVGPAAAARVSRLRQAAECDWIAERARAEARLRL